MRVREVVPADYNQSVVIPNSNIHLSKSIYNELHFQDRLEEKEPKEKTPNKER